MKRLYPLVEELAVHGIPVVAPLRVPNLSRGPFYRWRHHSVTAAEVVEAHRASALCGALCDDPELLRRFLRDEANANGEPMVGRTA